MSQAWLRIAITPVFMGAFLFGAAGRLTWLAAYLYIALVILMQVHVILTVPPDLLTERSRMREGTKSWDKVIAPLIALVLPMLMWLTAGLDVRAARPAPPPALQAAGFALAAISAYLTARAMAANRFFAATVRIQHDREHRVVSTGPYAIVRHPGCIGMLGFTIATPLALGSTLAWIPSAICVILLIVRTILEDRTLRAELAGYSDYASRVRYRLIPGIW